MAKKLKNQFKSIISSFKNEILSIVQSKADNGAKKITITIANDLAYPKNMPALKKKMGDKSSILYLSDIWQAFFNNKFQIIEDLVASEIVYDAGFIPVIKNCLKLRIGVQERLQNYLISMVLFGSWARGRAVKESDIDIAFVIDDTDVQKKTRLEIKDKLMKVITGISAEISKDFNVQVYLLTQFWEWVRDANPVIFTMLRDGVPVYDRGLFSPWKLLLKMGKIKPTPEAIESFMSSGKLLLGVVDNTMSDLIVEKLYYAMLNPAQSALMFVGVAPPVYTETPILLRRYFVKKKLLDAKYAKWLEDIIKIRKRVEHNSQKVTGKMLDIQIKRAKEFSMVLLTMFEKLKHESIGEKIKEIDFIFRKGMQDVLKSIGVKSTKERLVSKFLSEVKDRELMPASYSHVVQYVNTLKDDYKRGLVTQDDVNKLEKEAHDFIETVINIVKAREQKGTDKFKVKFKYDDKTGEVWFLGKTAYIIKDLSDPSAGVLKAKIKKDGALGKTMEASLKHLDKKRENVSMEGEATVKEKTISSLKKIFGTKVEIVLSD
ncbi:MAG TPA: nucleotidyltransferase domain-containing protein [Candidatus Woesearchaeota archaeon]|nr:nucleotidyltransferase domain-containing protein [Candidatus Woesearchaeota archaeon]